MLYYAKNTPNENSEKDYSYLPTDVEEQCLYYYENEDDAIEDIEQAMDPQYAINHNSAYHAAYWSHLEGMDPREQTQKMPCL